MSKLGRVAILCGGGPAPGFNSVISSVTIESEEKNYEVIGIYNGFQNIQKDKFGKDDYVVLKTDYVSRIMFDGGSVIGTSRANPERFDKKDKKKGFKNVLKHLKKLGISFLVTVGGDDTSTSARRVFEYSEKKVKVVHIPKTIDNDLPLPPQCVTFGFYTAVELGAKLVINMMMDAATMHRFFIVTSMGRHAGHLALGIGKSASAHLTLIMEEFIQHSKHPSFKLICDVIEGMILKRYMDNKPHGVIVLSEGLIGILKEEEIKKLFGSENVKYDSFGHIKLDLLDFEDKIKKEMDKRMRMRKLDAKFTTKKLGYELRCERPNSYDRTYTRDLGYGACTILFNPEKKGGCIITIVDGRCNPIMFEDLEKDEKGHTKIRRVDTDTESFRVARGYMIRLKKKDFSNKDRMSKLAKIGHFRNEKEYEKYFMDVKKMEIALKKVSSTYF